MSRGIQPGVLFDAVRWVSLAVFTAGTIRAVYWTVLGDGMEQSASLGRLIAVVLIAGVVMLWDLSRRERS